MDVLSQITTPAMPASDSFWASLLSVGQWILNLVLSGAWWWVSRKSNRIDQLESELKKKAEEYLNQKLETVIVKLTSAIDVLHTHVTNINQRLETGESDFARLGHRDQQTELKLVAMVGELKDYIHHNCADKSDMQRLTQQFQQLSNSVSELKASA